MAPFSTPGSRWAALQSRNPLATSAFIYSVLTTKIYCRPTCSSRLARRANVIFHDTPAEAEAAGFRPCKRCRPNLKENEGDPQILAVEKACDLIAEEKNGEVKWSVKALAKEVGLTESHFCRVFKKIMGMTIGGYRGMCASNASVKEGSNILDGQKTMPGHLEAAFSKSAYISDTIVPSAELSTPSLCTSEILQDWQSFSGLETPEDFLPDAADAALANIYNCDLTIPETWETADDCFQFVDFNTPWIMGLSREEAI
ncbi:metal binding domain of Ada-domain-containing protein [Cadophora sp. MPI-SDFR-AT-0126]|nr:metal binding domain of Ada-domain-containing protein [Leotiomycetes sp. MPI-SDFR-AT-0126]